MMKKNNPLSVNNLHKVYDKHAVLDAVHILVENREIFSLIGVNGAGKTTLIKCILDFHKANQGDIFIFDKLSSSTQARENLAYLPERFIPPHYLNGQQFLNYIFDLHQSKIEHSLVLQMLADLDLAEEILKKPVRKFSKGMAQKLGLAALLLLDKQLLILDEPMSGLDPKARALVKQQLKLAREKGKTIFFSSHLLADVEELSDRIAILHEGSIAFCGSPDACKQTYHADNLEQAFLKCIEV